MGVGGEMKRKMLILYAQNFVALRVLNVKGSTKFSGLYSGLYGLLGTETL